MKNTSKTFSVEATYKIIIVTNSNFQKERKNTDNERIVQF